MNITYTHADAQDFYQHSSKVTSKKNPRNIRKKHETTIPYFFLEFPTTRTLGTDPHIPLLKGTLRVVTHGSHLVDG